MDHDTIKAEHLKKTYTDAKGNTVTVLEDLTATFKAGQMYAIYGPSGCGKSTLLNLFGVLDHPTFGDIQIAGIETKRMSRDDLANLRRDKIGFVFQDHYMNQKLTVLQNMILPLRINKKIKPSQYETICKELLALFGVEEFAERFPSELSGGEQQRVCIARALVNSPDIILADEPTGNLDGENERIVLEYLKGLTNQNKTVIVVTHNDIVKEYADVVYELKGGKLQEIR